MGSEGFLDKHGKPYPKRKFEWMLKNIFYTGQFEWGKVIYQGKHTPIVSKDVFYAVQERFNKSLVPRKHDVQFPYTSLIRCSHCGCFLTAELQKGKNKKGEYIYYHCTGNRGGTCKKNYIRQERFDEVFQDVINSLYLPPTLVDTITKKMKEFYLEKSEYNYATITSLQIQIGNLTSRIEKIYIDKLDGTIEESFWKEKHNQWTNEKTQLLINLEAINNSDLKYYENMDLLFEFCKNAPALYNQANTEQKRNIINIMCSKLLFDGSKLDIELRTIFEDIRNIPKSENGADDGARTHAYRYHKPRP